MDRAGTGETLQMNGRYRVVMLAIRVVADRHAGDKQERAAIATVPTFLPETSQPVAAACLDDLNHLSQGVRPTLEPEQPLLAAQAFQQGSEVVRPTDRVGALTHALPH